MLSNNENKKILEAVKDASISIGTQILHAHHILHGFDPIILKKADLLTAHAKLIWDHHDIESLEGYIPDIAIRKISKAQKLFKEGEFLDTMIETLVGKANPLERKMLEKELEEINHDYSVTIDAIEKISTGHAEEINMKDIEDVVAHTDETEINAINNEDDITSVNKELHQCVLEELDKKEIDHINRVKSLIK